MYTVVKYSGNYSVFTSESYSDCVSYLQKLEELFNRFSIKTEKTETFLTAFNPSSETVYSIEYVKQ